MQQTRAAATREQPALHLDEPTIFYALNRVARHFEADSLTPDRYDLGGEQLRAKYGRTPGSVLPLILPSSGQILLLADGDWKKALRLAGLKEPEPIRNTPGVALEKLIEHHFETQNAKPGSYKRLRDYGKGDLGLRVPDLAGLRWAEWLERTRSARAERGLAFDDAGPCDGQRLTQAEIDALIAGAPKARDHGKWSEKKAVVSALADYVRAYDTKHDLRQKHYQSLRAEHGWPPVNAIQRHFQRFQDAIRAARREARKAP